MNCIGKKAFYFLFIIASFLSCRGCAAILFNVEQNFKCPICIFVKEFNITVTNYTFQIYQEPLNLLKSEILIYKLVKIINKKVFEYKENGISILQINSKTLSPNGISPEHLIPIKTQLYILFNQLRIGNDYHLIFNDINQINLKTIKTNNYV